MELSDYIRILRKRWILIALLTVAGIAGGLTASLVSTPLYTASTLVFVSVQNSGSSSDLVQGNSFVQQQVASYADAVSTPAVLDSVIDELALDQTPAELAEDITASAPLDTVNIEIQVTRDDPAEAARLANAITESFRGVISEITAPTNGDPSPVSVSVLRPATVPDEPVSPNTKLNLALGALVGLALGLGIAVLIELLDTRVRSERDIRAITDAPIVGGIAFDKNAPKKPLIVHDEPKSPRAEAFRTLRTNLQFLDVDGGTRSFVVTSALPGEGKSSTAANLAIALAQSGARVVVIDADLRRPALAKYLGLEGAVGLSDVLIGRYAVDDVIQEWGTDGLAVLPAGSRPPNPSELLGSSAMVDLLARLARDYDTILIDAPPLLPVTDAAVLSKLVRGALMVVAAGQTRAPAVEGALTVLDTVGAHVSGMVLTMLPTRGPDSYGYGTYAYGYGYNYAELPEKRKPSPAAPVSPAAPTSPDTSAADSATAGSSQRRP